jgi:hypothetical protein
MEPLYSQPPDKDHSLEEKSSLALGYSQLVGALPQQKFKSQDEIKAQ